MFWKKKTKMFGNAIDPDCAYCSENADGTCRLGRKQRPCSSFRYDPLKRTPENLPLPKEYNPDDFKL